MTTKEWLMRANRLDDEIKMLLKEKERALTAATSVNTAAVGEKVQTSRCNGTEKKFLHYAEYSELIDRRIDELYEIKQEILSVINSVNDSTLRSLLLCRYIQNKTWERIADEMHYSYVHVVHNLHPRALYEVKKAKGED